MADQMNNPTKPTKPTKPTNAHVNVASASPNADTNDTGAVSLVYNCQNPKAIVLAFHGGCFMHGHAGWDAKQNTMLASMHFTVHQLAFPKSWKAWQAWAKAFCWDAILPKQQNNDNGVNGVKVVCLGRSSGGYLACMFAAMHASHIDKLILMAPVLDPQKRASILTQFKANTDLFFASDDSDSCDVIRPASFDPAKTLLLLAGKDENVPAWMFTTQQINQAVFPGPVGHVGLLGCTSGRLNQIIQEFVL